MMKFLLKICIGSLGLVVMSVAAETKGVKNEVPATKVATKEISPKELDADLKQGKKYFLLDVRSPEEFALAKIEGSQNIPLDDLLSEKQKVDTNKDIVVICKSGRRAEKAMNFLVTQGAKTIKNLRGGIAAWSNEIDPKMNVIQ